jgi:hypothetical protein
MLLTNQKTIMKFISNLKETTFHFASGKVANKSRLKTKKKV